MTEAEFDDLYAALGRPLLAYLLPRMDSAEDAADLLAEAMTIVWTRRVTCHRSRSGSCGSFGIARNLVSRHRGPWSRHRRAVEQLAEALPDPPVTPAVAGLRVDLSRALRRLARSTPRSSRSARGRA